MYAALLPQFHTYERNVYAVYRSRQFVDAKIKRFVDALKRMSETAWIAMPENSA